MGAREERDLDHLRDALTKAWDELEICRESYAAMTKGWLATGAQRDAANALLREALAYGLSSRETPVLCERISKHLGY